MKRNRRLVEVIGFGPLFHQRYREMCSLAVVGQLGGPEMSDLNQHVASCPACRTFLEELAQASVQFLPALAEEKIVPTDVTTPAGMRARFLSRLAKESEGGFQPEPEMDRGGLQVVSRAARQQPPARPFAKYALVAAAVTVIVLAGGAGYYFGKRAPGASVSYPPPAMAPVRSLPVQAAKEPAAPAASGESVGDREGQKASLLARLDALNEQLARGKHERDSLQDQLSAANDRLFGLQQTIAASQQKSSDAAEVRNQVAALEAEARLLRQRLSDAQTRLAAHEVTNGQLSADLRAAETNLQRQEASMRDVGGYIGELVAARNLHIVDVYDADPNGKQTRAFGRVFYTEGKSLVFYAYDLEDAKQAKANIVFRAWGGKAGVKEVTHSLGILRKEDDGEGRWAMTFDDPKVLAQIDSVFVTVEPARKRYDEPHGKKVLYAYFGGHPNHP